jgi:hypothetical protein
MKKKSLNMVASISAKSAGRKPEYVTVSINERLKNNKGGSENSAFPIKTHTQANSTLSSAKPYRLLKVR